MQTVPADVPEAGTRNSLHTLIEPVKPDRLWQQELSEAIRSVPELLLAIGLWNSQRTFDENLASAGITLPADEITDRFPLLVPRSFVDRMAIGDPRDPLLRQVLPVADEATRSAGFVSDAVGDEHARRAPGMLHKYDGRVLLITTGTCAVHCRYCFRRDYPYSAEPRRLDDWQPALDLIASDTSIHEVILSGGDPLMLSDERLRTLCQLIDNIPHIERIRIHSRLPIVLPSRMTDSLLSTLLELRTQPIMVVHANHAQEIAGDCATMLRHMVRSGLPVLNQAVLLRGINDSVEALEALCRSLIRLGVMPYYLNQLDRVTGTSHFEVPREHGLALIAELTKRLPGYAVPRYVEELPGGSSKTPISLDAIL